MAMPTSRWIFWQIPWYSTLIVIGIVMAIYLASCEEKRLGLPTDTAVDIGLVVVPCGIIGARIYYVAMSWSYFASDPLSVFYIWEGGMAIYGGVIGGVMGVYAYARKKKLSFLTLIDIIAPGLILAQAIGRWGNYFNMEAYGAEIVDPAFWFFPFGVLIPTATGEVWHMATFFYESVWNVCGFAVLWLLRKKQKQAGNVFCWYLLLYASGRFIIEQLRTDSLYLGAFRASQMLSFCLCALAGIILLWRALKDDKRRLGMGILCLIVLLMRWAFLDRSVIYGVLGLLSAGLAMAVLWQNGQALFVLLPFFLDGMGLALNHTLSYDIIRIAIHTMLCSITLPLYVGLMMKGTKESQHAQRCT